MQSLITHGSPPRECLRRNRLGVLEEVGTDHPVKGTGIAAGNFRDGLATVFASGKLTAPSGRRVNMPSRSTTIGSQRWSWRSLTVRREILIALKLALQDRERRQDVGGRAIAPSCCLPQ